MNRNLYGGTLFLTFAFNWIFNWWVLHSLARGFVADHAVVFATEIAFLVIFLLITWGFGHFSTLLFVFLLDIDLLYALKVAGRVLHTRAFDLPVALLTVGLAGLSLWIAFALLLNPVTGRRVFRLGGPLFSSKVRPLLDLSVRTAVVSMLYGRWREAGSAAISLEDLVTLLPAFPEQRVRAEVEYLAARNVVELSAEAGVRLSPAGIDQWEGHLAG